ncbi:MAG: magnesium transporter [Eubacteriales bacterium]|nr:magnesium transporter [Eubacteriales bacterium]MDD4324030.1 magnesium transporter [Eubacteriales bacterium]MDD4541575.1 magnesium transporter [Eubacteriales bacterium]
MKEKILSLIEAGKYFEARNEISKLNVVDAAQLFEDIDHVHVLIVFRILPKDFSSEVFSYMSSDLQKSVIDSMTDEEAVRIFDDLYFDDAVDFLEEMPANVVKRILKNSDDNTRTLINQFLKYPADSAGSLMTIEYVDLKKEMTVRQAIDYIKKIGIDKRTINTCYVMNESRILEGRISIRKLILNDEAAIIADIMETDVISVNTLDDQEDVAALFKKYDYYIVPVVDTENRLVGIITVDDILDVIDQEATEDFQKMAATKPSDTEYLKTSNWGLAKNRIPWLLVLMISATLTGGIIQRYEHALQSVIILAAFIPMLMDTGGNSGSQSSSLVIRGLALGEIKTTDILKVIWKEFSVGSIAGSILAAVNFVRIMIFENTSMEVAFTVSLTMFLVVVIAKVVGGILPIAAQKLKLDPAVMAGPLITTIVDAAALMIYFSLATLLLGI